MSLWIKYSQTLTRKSVHEKQQAARKVDNLGSRTVYTKLVQLFHLFLQMKAMKTIMSLIVEVGKSQKRREPRTKENMRKTWKILRQNKNKHFL